MAVRRPLYWNGSDVQEMTDALIDELVDQCVYQYSTDPSVTMSVVSSSGTLDAMDDTRKKAGAHSTSTTSFPSEGTTAEPGTVTVTYDKMSSANASTSEVADTSNQAFPVYYDGSGSIQSMTLQDMKDTIFEPAIDLLTSGSTGTQQGGTYFISTSTSVSGATEVSGANTAVFTDTRADTSAYASGDIPETLDQPTTIANYYLHKITGSDTSYTAPLINDGGDLKTIPDADFETILKTGIRHMATSETGYRISYNINGSGNNRGTAMTDTILNGSGNYQTRQVNTDDYRAQEFPNGTAVTATTYNLKINKS